MTASLQSASQHDAKPKKNLFNRCVFCRPEPELVLFSTEHFQVILDKYPLMEGHIIIHSRKHIGCAGEIPKEDFAELTQIKEKIRHILELHYGAAVFYEHGRAGHCMQLSPNTRLCHHFHMHALPLKEEEGEELATLLSKRFRPIALNNEKELPLLFERYGEYLYTESAQGEQFFFPANTDIESHYIRTLIAKKIGKPERANWETYNKGPHYLPAKALLLS